MTTALKEVIEEEVKRQWRDPEEAERFGKLKEYKFTVKKSFFLKTRPGPAEAVQPGELVVLYDRFSIDHLFYSKKIEPIEPGIPETGEYLVIKKFVTVVEGVYKSIEVHELLRLTRDEAIDMLRRHLVKPLDETTFCLY